MHNHDDARKVKRRKSLRDKLRAEIRTLVAWPILTAVPAFLVALAVAAALARRKQSV